MGNFINTLAFVVFPYITLTIFVVGHAYRYITDLKNWNAKSSQMLEKNSIKYGISLFHWGIILVLFGHAGGMLIPQSIYEMFGISEHLHELIAYYMGIFAGALLIIGVIWLLVRRITRKRISANTSVNDYVLLVFILLVSAVGMSNVLFTHYDVINTVAPWIRSIVILSPRPDLMQPIPFGYKLHILLALALLAYSPFTRLVHIWSVPVSYVYRSYVVYRRRLV